MSKQLHHPIRGYSTFEEIVEQSKLITDQKARLKFLTLHAAGCGHMVTPFTRRTEKDYILRIRPLECIQELLADRRLHNEKNAKVLTSPLDLVKLVHNFNPAFLHWGSINRGQDFPDVYTWFPIPMNAEEAAIHRHVSSDYTPVEHLTAGIIVIGPSREWTHLCLKHGKGANQDVSHGFAAEVVSVDAIKAMEGGESFSTINERVSGEIREIERARVMEKGHKNINSEVYKNVDRTGAYFIHWSAIGLFLQHEGSREFVSDVLRFATHMGHCTDAVTAAVVGKCAPRPLHAVLGQVRGVTNLLITHGDNKALTDNNEVFMSGPNWLDVKNLPSSKEKDADLKLRRLENAMLPKHGMGACPTPREVWDCVAGTMACHNLAAKSLNRPEKYPFPASTETLLPAKFNDSVFSIKTEKEARDLDRPIFVMPPTKKEFINSTVNNQAVYRLAEPNEKEILKGILMVTVPEFSKEKVQEIREAAITGIHPQRYREQIKMVSEVYVDAFPGDGVVEYLFTANPDEEERLESPFPFTRKQRELPGIPTMVNVGTKEEPRVACEMDYRFGDSERYIPLAERALEYFELADIGKDQDEAGRNVAEELMEMINPPPDAVRIDGSETLQFQNQNLQPQVEEMIPIDEGHLLELVEKVYNPDEVTPEQKMIKSIMRKIERNPNLAHPVVMAYADCDPVPSHDSLEDNFLMLYREGDFGTWGLKGYDQEKYGKRIEEIYKVHPKILPPRKIKTDDEQSDDPATPQNQPMEIVEDGNQNPSVDDTGEPSGDISQNPSGDVTENPSGDGSQVVLNAQTPGSSLVISSKKAARTLDLTSSEDDSDDEIKIIRHDKTHKPSQIKIEPKSPKPSSRSDGSDGESEESTPLKELKKKSHQVVDLSPERKVVPSPVKEIPSPVPLKIVEPVIQSSDDVAPVLAKLSEQSHPPAMQSTPAVPAIGKVKIVRKASESKSEQQSDAPSASVVIASDGLAGIQDLIELPKMPFGGRPIVPVGDGANPQPGLIRACDVQEAKNVDGVMSSGYIREMEDDKYALTWLNGKFGIFVRDVSREISVKRDAIRSTFKTCESRDLVNMLAIKVVAEKLGARQQDQLQLSDITTAMTSMQKQVTAQAKAMIEHFTENLVKPLVKGPAMFGKDLEQIFERNIIRYCSIYGIPVPSNWSQIIEEHKRMVATLDNFHKDGLDARESYVMKKACEKIMEFGSVERECSFNTVVTDCLYDLEMDCRKIQINASIHAWIVPSYDFDAECPNRDGKTLFCQYDHYLLFCVAIPKGDTDQVTYRHLICRGNSFEEMADGFFKKIYDYGIKEYGLQDMSFLQPKIKVNREAELPVPGVVPGQDFVFSAATYADSLMDLDDWETPLHNLGLSNKTDLNVPIPLYNGTLRTTTLGKFMLHFYYIVKGDYASAHRVANMKPPAMAEMKDLKAWDEANWNEFCSTMMEDKSFLVHSACNVMLSRTISRGVAYNLSADDITQTALSLVLQNQWSSYGLQLQDSKEDVKEYIQRINKPSGGLCRAINAAIMSKVSDQMLVEKVCAIAAMSEVNKVNLFNWSYTAKMMRLAPKIRITDGNKLVYGLEAVAQVAKGMNRKGDKSVEIIHRLHSEAEAAMAAIMVIPNPSGPFEIKTDGKGNVTSAKLPAPTKVFTNPSGPTAMLAATVAGGQKFLGSGDKGNAKPGTSARESGSSGDPDAKERKYLEGRKRFLEGKISEWDKKYKQPQAPLPAAKKHKKDDDNKSSRAKSRK